MAIGYSAQNVDPEVTSKALGRDIPVKPKFTVNVCRAIKGMRVEQAKTWLEKVIALEQAVPFTIHKRHVKHHSSSRGPGAYPVNSAKAVLQVLKDAESNAEYKGLDPEEMFVWHTAAHRASPIQGFMPRAQGRATAWNKSTTHIEIVLKERASKADAALAEDAKAVKAAKDAKPAKAKDAKAKKKPAAKKAAPKKTKKEEA